MSYEMIRAVKIKPDGVYLNSKSSNDSIPFHDWKSDTLTEIYNREGQRGLDREIVRMLHEYASIRGDHPSVTRYYPCLQTWGTLGKPFIQTINAEYEKLSPEDKATVMLPDEKKTHAAKEYEGFRRNAENAMYERLALLAKEPDAAIENRNHTNDYLFDASADDEDMEI